MSFREQMQVKVSNAELTLFLELQKCGLTRGMITQHAFTFNMKEDRVAGTWIDFYWADPVRYAVFLDGDVVHAKHRQSVRDEYVTKALQKRGVTVDRFSYHAPLRKFRLKEICDQIESKLKELP